MKLIKPTLIIAFIALFSFTKVNAQEPEKKQVSASDWAELKSFHGVMAQTFHPAEEGDFKPIRERAKEMHDKAVAVVISKPPAEFDNNEIKAALMELEAKTAEVERLVNSKADDATLMKSLTAAHDAFHKIVGLCKQGDDHHKE